MASLKGKGTISVCAVIPAYNEAARIAATVRALKEIPALTRILVVDDGSADDTAALAAAADAEILALRSNGGKARAMAAGYQETQEEILLFLDADLGTSAAMAHALLVPILEGRAQGAVIRFPFASGKGGFGLVKALARYGVRRLTGRDFESVLSGQRAYLRSCLRPSDFSYPGFGIEFGMTVDLLNRGVTLTEVEAPMVHRTTGRDLRGFLHRARQFRDILWVAVKKGTPRAFQRRRVKDLGGNAK